MFYRQTARMKQQITLIIVNWLSCPFPFDIIKLSIIGKNNIRININREHRRQHCSLSAPTYRLKDPVGLIKIESEHKQTHCKIKQQQPTKYTINLHDINKRNMVALNSTKYIYPFGGSAEKPVVDPDKQIGRCSPYCDISISFAICQYIVSNIN